MAFCFGLRGIKSAREHCCCPNGKKTHLIIYKIIISLTHQGPKVTRQRGGQNERESPPGEHWGCFSFDRAQVIEETAI